MGPAIGGGWQCSASIYLLGNMLGIEDAILFLSVHSAREKVSRIKGGIDRAVNDRHARHGYPEGPSSWPLLWQRTRNAKTWHGKALKPATTQ